MDEGKLVALFRQVVREELGAAQPMVFSYEAAAKRLDVSERSIRRMVKGGELMTITIGRLPKIPLSELERVTSLAPLGARPEFGRRKPKRQDRRQMEARSEARRAKEAREQRITRAPKYDAKAASARLRELMKDD